MNKIAIALCCVLCAACIVDGEPHREFEIEPIDLGDGWPIALPEQVGMDPVSLEDAYRQWWNDDGFRAALSLIVARNGYLVKEGYARAESDRTQPFHIVSCTKSITSLIVGIARRLGYLRNLDQPLSEIIPDAFTDTDALKRTITLRDALTMSSGIDYYNDHFSLEIIGHNRKDVIPHILSKPMYADPGEEFYYWDADPHLVSAAIKEATGEDMEILAQQYLLGPLGITDFKWETDRDGLPLGPFGAYLRARDMAKIGQLMLQRGQWNGETIIEESWFIASISPQIDLPADDPEYAGRHYGYYWWFLEDLGAIAALGHGGNYIYIIPDEELVIVQTAQPSTNYDYGAAITTERFFKIADAIVKSIVEPVP
jgi:CubicO group peptidase (beta-lactamase class C family)